jgi:predicted amidophosphoribosyltransferase
MFGAKRFCSKCGYKMDSRPASFYCPMCGRQENFGGQAIVPTITTNTTTKPKENKHE